ncbi:hypothetical protein QAD02_013002 [Eretmocerus hayati]|uniref:Uncharacterized protein n=1 Tax=Eretmocerus hayati TaxID=131215 RepID=A0ACC2P0X2_9HYME|nr:hypothetical protein QAD02_013002 [Eretmocerus hayati]
MNQLDKCENQASYSCYTCGQIFSRRTVLKQHEKLEHPDTLKGCKCSECPKHFKFNSKLKFHLKTAHRSSDKYMCQDCCIHFKDSASLKHHRIDQHGVIRTKKDCLVCQKSVPQYYMKKHMKSHELDSNRDSIICSEYDKHFATSELLENHVKKNHQPPECSICLATFASTYLLSKHKMLVHADCPTNHYTCTQCSKIFVTIPELKQHRSHHSSARLSECHICSFKSKTKANLRQHCLDKHKTDLYQCSDCLWEFKRESDLKRHQISHSTLAKYACEVCGAKFKYLPNMHRHVKKNQGMMVSDSDSVFDDDVVLG